MEIKLTNEEKEAIELYKNGEYKVINQLLVSDSNSDIALLRDDVENGSVKILYDRETLVRDLKALKIIYELLQKVRIKRNRNEEWAFVRGTNVIEVERFRKETFIDKALDATKNRELAENQYALLWNEPAVMYIRGSKDIAYLDFSEITELGLNDNQDILISPFTKIRNISNNGDIKNGNKSVKTYNVYLEKQELQGMPKEDKQNLYINILGNSDYINIKLNEVIRLERENQNIYENIRKLESLAAKTESDLERKRELENYSEYEIKIDEENLERLKREIISLQNEVKNIYDKIKECTDFITNWKKSVTVYVMSECYDIDVNYENVKPEENNFEEYVAENDAERHSPSKDAFSSSGEQVEDAFSTEETKEVSDETVVFKPIVEETIENVDEELTEEYAKTAEEVIEEENEIEENENSSEDNMENSSDEVIDEDTKTEAAVEENIEESDSTEAAEDDVADDVAATERSELSIRAERGQECEIVHNEEDADEDNEDEAAVDSTDISEKPIEITEKIKEIREACKENTSTVNRVLENIAYLIYKQQNFAKIAGTIGGRYSALNNCFEMRKQAEDLKVLLQEVQEKAEHIYNFNDENAIEKLNKISDVNNQISILLNYLNNPKSSVGKARINRFEEMAIIEENELKRNIADLLQDIRGEAELKKLKDDLEIIEDKNPLQKLLGIFTGRNKLDEVMVEQIIIRQEAIRRTMAKNLRLDYNYSIHELVAETEMFIRENSDDELVEDDVKRLKIIEEELKQNFIILEEKVKDIINEREGRSLPIDERVTREELIEIETFRFLKKYRYDQKEDHSPEVEYQDTTANEIFTIIDYIKTSNIL